MNTFKYKLSIKNILTIIIVLAMAVCLVGCNSKQETKKTSANAEVQVENTRALSNEWYGKLGRYSAGVPREILTKGFTEKTELYSVIHFFDYKTLNEIVLCNKPNCKHYDSSCNACFKMDECSTNTLLFGYNDKIYLVTSKHIYTMNEDGTEHKKILDFPKDLSNNFSDELAGFLVVDTLYVQLSKELQMKFDKNGDPLEGEVPSEYVLLKVDLKDKSTKRIYKYNYTNDYDQQWIGVSNNKAYYCWVEQYNDIPRGPVSRKNCEKYEREMDTKLISVDLKTGKETLEFRSTSKYYYHLLMHEDNIFYHDLTKGEIIKYNPKTKKKKILVKDLFEYTERIIPSVINNKLFYEIDYDCLDYYTKKNSKDATCYVDIDTCEVTEVEYRYKSFDSKYSNFSGVVIETPEYYIVPFKDVGIGNDEYETYFGKIKIKDFWNKNYDVKEIDWK